ncbi:MAG: GAF and ANTAR domain-containing protein [Cryobacterium sp.]
MTPPSHASLVSATFVKLTEALAGDYDALAVLHTLVEQSVQLLDATAAGLLLADAHGQLHLVASSSRQSELLELLQLHAGVGPCLEAYRTGRVVTVRDLRTDERYREFGAAALAQGFVSVHAVPMRAGAATIGGLNLFRSEPGLLTEDDAAIARALADVATMSIVKERTARQNAITNERLQRALTSRILIEQAKGVIAQGNTITMDEAFNRLRAHARSHNITVQSSAESVVNRLLQL